MAAVDGPIDAAAENAAGRLVGEGAVVDLVAGNMAAVVDRAAPNAAAAGEVARES
jgi:hypothetical protein